MPRLLFLSVKVITGHESGYAHRGSGDLHLPWTFARLSFEIGARTEAAPNPSEAVYG